MSHSKVHSRGTIPFSWENKPGVSKEFAHQEWPAERQPFRLNLPPPPCPSETARVPVHDFQIPLPPCAFQPPAPSRSSSKKGHGKHEDPFLAAYKECTKSINDGKGKKLLKNDVGSMIRKKMFVFSCKRSCSVRIDNLVKISQLPFEREGDRKRETTTESEKSHRL